MMYCYQCMNQIGNDGYCPHCRMNSTPKILAHHLRPGTVLNNKYLVGNALGEGGFGITYIGRDLTLDIRVAVKEYFPNGFVNRRSDNSIICSSEKQQQVFQKGKERFLQEARSLAKFSDEKGVVFVREYFESGGTAYIVMEYLDGITLQEYLYQHKTIDAESVFTMMLPMISSLERMHNAHIIHRDISPDNIMFLRDGSLKLMDFGSARYFTNGEKEMSVMIKQGFAPEEQYRRNGEQGPWTDVYGLCATIYTCITGTVPEISLNRLHSDTLKRPSELGVRIDPQLESTLMYGLAVDHRNRCRNMTELRQLITNALNRTQISGFAQRYGGGAYTQLDDRNQRFPANPGGQKYTPPGSIPPGNMAREAISPNDGFTSIAVTKEKSSVRVVIAVVAVILLVGIGVLLFFLFYPGSDNDNDRSDSVTDTRKTTETLYPTQKPSQTELSTEEETTEPTEKTVEVPNVVGKRLDQAISELTEYDLKPVWDSDGNSYENYKVVGQYPKAGDTVKSGTEITLYISLIPDDPTKAPQETKAQPVSDEPTYPPNLNGGEIESWITQDYSYGETLYCRVKNSVTLRDIASRFGDSIGTISCNEEVTYLGSVNDFYKIEYDGKVGYALAKYFYDDPDAPLPGGTGLFENGSILYCVANEFLTMFDGPSFDAKKILLIKRGEAVRFIEDDDNDPSFAKITYNGYTGYVVGRYLNDDKNGDILPPVN